MLEAKVPKVAIVAVVSIKPLYKPSLIPASSIQLSPVKASWYSAVAKVAVPKPAAMVIPPTTPVNVAPPIPAAMAKPPLISAGTATIDNPIAVIALLSEATPPIVSPNPTAAIPHKIANTGKCPDPSE